MLFRGYCESIIQYIIGPILLQLHVHVCIAYQVVEASCISMDLLDCMKSWFIKL